MNIESKGGLIESLKMN